MVAIKEVDYCKVMELYTVVVVAPSSSANIRVTLPFEVVEADMLAVKLILPTAAAVALQAIILELIARKKKKS